MGFSDQQLIDILKEKNVRIFTLENELENINSAYEKNLSLLKIENSKLNNEIIELKKLNDDELNDNKYSIIFKKINYLVDENNNVYNIVNGKASKIVGQLKNNKVKFI